MFDRIVVAPRTTERIYERRDVHEHRAPTDESVKLLKEMEEKAEGKLVASVAVESNTFNCVVHMWRDARSDRTILRAIFDLNGHKMTVEEGSHLMERSDKEDLIVRLRDGIAEKIATEMLAAPLRTMKL